jgi:hypothetical protein
MAGMLLYYPGTPHTAGTAAPTLKAAVHDHFAQARADAEAFRGCHLRAQGQRAQPARTNRLWLSPHHAHSLAEQPVQSARRGRDVASLAAK